MKEVFIASIGNSYVDFSKLDLSPWKIRGGKLLDEITKNYLTREFSLTDTAWEQITNATQRGVGSGMYIDYEHRSLLWPLDKNDPPSKADFYEVIDIIKILHPSEVYIHNIFHTSFDKDCGRQVGMWSQNDSHVWTKYENPEEHFFIYPEKHFKETNKLLRLFKENKGISYINNAIKYYSDSYIVNSREMSFICLCISLETIVPGNEQLSFRFRRNLAVLCSSTEEMGNKIFEKAKKLYTYRSTLVHSGMNKKNNDKFDIYFKYAQFLSSRMIIEMILHQISNIEALDKRLTELGFGEKQKISLDYKELVSNLPTWIEVSEYKL